jgi:antitoxin component YwqK of YwqJK toxin-antitoxin module
LNLFKSRPIGVVVLKKKYLIFLAVLVINGCGKTEYSLSELSIKKNIAYLKESGDLFTGTAFKENKNGKRVSEIEFKLGKQDGVINEWYDNGDLKLQASARKNEKGQLVYFGDFSRWYENGQLAEKVTFSEAGERVGEWNLWYANGNPKSIFTYNEQGEKHGILAEYCENGTRKKERNFKDGVLDGEYREWSCAGKETTFKTYVLGKQKGPYVVYRALGSEESPVKQEEGSYDEEGRQHGSFKRWHSMFGSGPSEEGQFEHGKKVGLWKKWDSEGKLSYTDYREDAFIDPEYAAIFQKKAMIGDRIDWRTAKPDENAVRVYLDRGLVDPAKKLNKQTYSSQDGGVKFWSYPILGVPESLYDLIAGYPGVDVNITDSWGRNRLYYCVKRLMYKERCSLEHAKKLINEKAVTNVDNEGETVLQLIVETSGNTWGSRFRGQVKKAEPIAAELIDAISASGVDINITSSGGRTALMLALGEGMFSLAGKLLDAGADPLLKDEEGHDSLRYLFINVEGTQIRTGLDDDGKIILKRLIEAGVSLKSPVDKEKTIYDLALKYGATDLLQYLEELPTLIEQQQAAKSEQEKVQPMKHENNQVTNESSMTEDG